MWFPQMSSLWPLDGNRPCIRGLPQLVCFYPWLCKSPTTKKKQKSHTACTQWASLYLPGKSVLLSGETYKVWASVPSCSLCWEIKYWTDLVYHECFTHTVIRHSDSAARRRSTLTLHFNIAYLLPLPLIVLRGGLRRCCGKMLFNVASISANMHVQVDYTRWNAGTFVCRLCEHKHNYPVYIICIIVHLMMHAHIIG